MLRYFLLFVKLGLFPFHFRVTVVSVKINLFMLFLALGLQKLILFWILRLINLNFIYLISMMIVLLSYLLVVAALFYLNDF